MNKSFMSQFKGEYILLILVSLFFLNIFSSCSYIGFILLMYLLLTKTNFLLRPDKNAIYLFVFGFLYSVFGLCNNAIDLNVQLMVYILFPFLLYKVGLVFGKLIKSDNNLLKIILSLSILFAILYLFSVLRNVAMYGFGGLNRDMPIMLIRNEGVSISATLIGMMFCPLLPWLPIFLFSKKGVNEKNVLIVGGLFTILAIISTCATATRTPIFILILLCIFAYIYNLKSISLFKKISGTVIITLGVSFISTLDFESIEMTSALYSRTAGKDSGVFTAGERSYCWLVGLENIFNYPMGGGYMLDFHYYHNFWLDTMRVAGVIPLFILLLFSYSAFIEIWKFLKEYRFSIQSRNLIGALFLALVLQFFTEPIIEGCFTLFLFFCFFIGLIRQYRLTFILHSTNIEPTHKQKIS